ncbi:hypothetical protein KKC44_02875 [Patescibacteria group bacterium]|nr:hypothetical protein [Patescibacteria group bacterium]MBU2259528.1 hypothetical protein [Patescibacteria group bacterium]
MSSIDKIPSGTSRRTAHSGTGRGSREVQPTEPIIVSGHGYPESDEENVLFAEEKDPAKSGSDSDIIRMEEVEGVMVFAEPTIKDTLGEAFVKYRRKLEAVGILSPASLVEVLTKPIVKRLINVLCGEGLDDMRLNRRLAREQTLLVITEICTGGKDALDKLLRNGHGT